MNPVHSCLFVILMLLAANSSAEWHKLEQNIMGTVIRVELFHEDPKLAQQAIQVAMAEMRRIDRLMSPYKPSSNLSRINANAATKPVKVDPELFDLIDKSLYFSRLTRGAFDITFASIGRYYDYRKGIKPSDEQIKNALKRINYRHIQLDRKAHTIRFSMSGVSIDLGGIAKGYAVDNAIHLLIGLGIKHAIVTAGGDSRIIGDRLGRPWLIGIRDPRKSRAVKGTIPLVDSALSTSGDYERYFVKNGEHYHHILKPSTGKSAKKLRSVTIIGPDATTTDALSTSVFVMGPEKGLELVEKMDGIEAILIDQHDHMIYSSGLLTRNNPKHK